MIFQKPPIEDVLMHYGVKRRSGRYPWGSGDSPYQHSGDFLSRVEELKKQGLSESEIAKELGILGDKGQPSTTKLRTAMALAKHERRELEVQRAKSLREDGYSLNEIAEKMGYANDKLVGSMTAIFNEFTDGLNLIESVTIRGKQNWIDFYTKTGVCIEFSFRPSSPSLSDVEKNAEMQEIVKSASVAEQTYLSLSESEKRLGYVLVYMKANGEICVEHAEKKAEIN